MIPKMVRFQNARLLAVVIVGICTTVSVAAWSLSAHFAQGPARERVIQKTFTRSAPVVEIAEIKVSQKAVELGKSFDEDDDWLNRTFLKVKNISNKPIIYLAVNVNFPETRATGGMMSYPIVFGQMPGSKFPQKQDPMFMMSGDTLEIPLTKHYAKIKSFVERRHRIAYIHKAELEIGFVVFADKTAWMAGEYLRQDPNDPDHFINVGDRPPQ